jgi:predicted Rossmann fold nucleotide-binding protein DprA/Smf involved in DNA uptake
MAQTLDIGAIAQQARIKQIEDQLKQHEKLTDEVERLRDALSRLEEQARSHPSSGRRNRKPAVKRAAETTRTRTANAASSPARAPRGHNKVKVLDALTDGPKTASEIARVTGIGTGTVSTMLSSMAKSGELAKAERGYRLPQ